MSEEPPGKIPDHENGLDSNAAYLSPAPLKSGRRWWKLDTPVFPPGSGLLGRCLTVLVDNGKE